MSPLLTTRRERACAARLGGGGRLPSAARRGVDGGAVAAPGRSAASQATRRRPRAPVAACHGVTAGAAGFWTNGSSRVSRRRATRRRGDVACGASARQLAARRIRVRWWSASFAALREALSLSPPASDGAAHGLALLALIAAARERAESLGQPITCNLTSPQCHTGRRRLAARGGRDGPPRARAAEPGGNAARTRRSRTTTSGGSTRTPKTACRARRCEAPAP